MAGSSRIVNSGACFESAALIVWGPGAVSTRHSHACAQLTVALTGALRVRERARGPWRSCRAVAVRAHADHEIDGRGALVLIGFIDAESTLGAAVTSRRSAVGIVSRAEAARWRLALGDPETLDPARVKRWLATAVMPGTPRTRVHPRVEHVMRLLQDQPLDTRTTSLVNLSRIAGLSSSRFAHVFTESMGTPLRPFMRWLRLRRAARELVSGGSVTHAAHVAGFADAAHLTRTFRRMLGGTPRILIRRGNPDRGNGSGGWCPYHSGPRPGGTRGGNPCIARYKAMSLSLLTWVIGLLTVAVVMAMFVVMWAARTSLATSRAAVLSGIVLAGWVATVALLGLRGAFAQPDGNSIPPVGIVLLVAFAVMLIAFGISASLRSLFTNQPHLIRLNVWRLVGAVFLLLMLDGQMPALWALPAGIGDVAVGATAFWVARKVATGSGRPQAIVFTLFGLADLVVAVGLGIMTSPGPLQVFQTIPTAELVTQFPLVLVPTFLVPLACALHVISLTQLIGGTWARPIALAPR